MAPSRYYSSTARQTTLTVDATAIATTLSIAAATGWPSLYPYTLIIDEGTVDEEVVTVTNRSGTTLTVTRGVDGTSGVAHTAGASVKHGVSARDFSESRDHEDSSEDVHGIGASAAVVGTITAQTLSNKTLGTALAAGGFKITGLADPASAQDAATKNYVDTGASSQVASATFYAAAASVSAADSATSAAAASVSAASALAYAAAASVSAAQASAAISASAVPLSTVDVKGDLIVGTAADAVGRLAAGTDGYVLSASAAAAAGLAYRNIDGDLALKLDLSPTQNTQTADYDFALADATSGKLVVANKATAIAFTVLQQSSVTWGTGAVLRWFNKNDGVLTITAGSGVTFIGTSLTYAKGTGGMAVRTASNEWVVLPFSSGSGVGRGTISGTTGSPTSGSNGGATYYEWTADGTFTVATAGLFDMLVVGGGGGGGGGVAAGGAGGGGAGGGVTYLTSVYLTAGAYTVNVGAGGVAGAVGCRGANGESTTVGPIVAAGGGGGGSYTTGQQIGLNGGSGGGAAGGVSGPAGGLPASGQGFAGGDGGSTAGGGPGGGGASAAGTNSSAAAGAAGGAGLANNIKGTGSTTYGGGGGGGGYSAAGGSGGAGGGGAGSSSTGAAGSAGTASTGGGGGGGAAAAGASSAGGAGATGVAILLVGTV